MGHGRAAKAKAAACAFAGVLLPVGAAAAQTGGAKMPSAAASAVPAQDEVTLVADRFSEQSDGDIIIAEGNVAARYGDRRLFADKVTYFKATQRVRAAGNVVIVEPDGSQRFADEVEVSENLSDGFAVGFSTRLPSGATAAAATAVRREGGVNALERAVYTACVTCPEDPDPTWTLRAREALLDEEAQMYTYRDAVLEVGGVPVFYTPYFAHPDPRAGRRSGLLFPSPGVSSKLGAFYRQPYYLVLSPSSDLTLEPLVTTKVRPVLGARYRKRFYSGAIDLEGSVTQERLFDSSGERDPNSDDTIRGHVFGEGLFNINEDLLWGFGIEHASDDEYIRRYDINGEQDERGLFQSAPLRLISQLFLVGQTRDSYFDASLISFQGLRAVDNNDLFPTVAPLAVAETVYDFGQLGVGSLNASAAFLSRNNAADSNRISVGADWTGAYILPGGVRAEPFATARLDQYFLDEDFSGTDEVGRTVANAGLRLSYPLIRRGANSTIIIEPTAMVSVGTDDPNDPRIPQEDTIFFEADETILFDGNGVGPNDLFEGGTTAAIGVVARARFAGGSEISTTFGRRFRSDADAAFGPGSNLDGTDSDWVAGAAVDLGQSFRFDTQFRLDDEDLSVQRLDAALRANFWRLTTSVSYFKISEDISPLGRADEGIQAFGELDITDNVFISGGLVRDIEGTPALLRNTVTGVPLRDANNNFIFDSEPRNLRAEIGIGYQDDCSRFELVYSRSDAFDGRLDGDESIQFRFSLLTLGEVGERDLD